uniref:hypothetical protein n=1 Tax=Rhizobium fredii TaxID=380 RepID=UPI001AEBBC74
VVLAGAGLARGERRADIFAAGAALDDQPQQDDEVRPVLAAIAKALGIKCARGLGGRRVLSRLLAPG